MSALCNSYKCGPCVCIPIKGLISCSHANLRTYPNVPMNRLFNTLDVRHNRISSLPSQQVLNHFKRIDLRGNPLNCSGIQFFIDSRILQDVCTPTPCKNCTTISSQTLDSDHRKVSNHKPPVFSDTSGNPQSESPTMTIAISTTGVLSFCVFTSVATGICWKKHHRKKRKPSGRRSSSCQSITSSGVDSSMDNYITLQPFTPAAHGLDIPPLTPTDPPVAQAASQQPLSLPPPPTVPPPPLPSPQQPPVGQTAPQRPLTPPPLPPTPPAPVVGPESTEVEPMDTEAGIDTTTPQGSCPSTHVHSGAAPLTTEAAPPPPHAGHSALPRPDSQGPATKGARPGGCDQGYSLPATEGARPGGRHQGYRVKGCKRLHKRCPYDSPTKPPPL